MKILIIFVRFNNQRLIYNKHSTAKNKNYLIPVGLAYISAVLKESGHEVSCLNLNNREGLVEDIIRQELTSDHYDFVFLGGLSIYYPDIKDCVAYIRSSSPKTKIVLGGGLISSQPEIMFGLLKPDFIVIGEGEITARELVACVGNLGDLSQVNGIGYKTDGKLVFTKERQPILDLDRLPFPDYSGIGYEEYLKNSSATSSFINDFLDSPRSYTIIGSRSCPYNCTFCYHPLGKKYRQRSVDNIMDELKYAIEKYHINLVIFLDELFSQNTERVIEFCQKFKTYTDTLSWNVYWTCSLRVDGDLSLIPVMKDSGCSLVALGLESYSPTILKSMRKHIAQEQIRDTLASLAENKIACTGNFIFGDTAETLKTAEETLDFFRNRQDLLRGSIALGFIIPFQGTPIYQHCVKTGKIKDEIEFIEQRAEYGYDINNPMNLTESLSGREFEKLKDMVFTTSYVTRKFIIPKKDWWGVRNGIEINCPYCDKPFYVMNRKLPKIFDQEEISCRNCHGRFVLVSNHMYLVFCALVKFFGFTRLYLLKQRIRRGLSP